MIEILIGVLIGLLLFCAGNYIFRLNRLAGDLIVVEGEDPEQPYIFLEATKSVRHMTSKRYVIFKVNKAPRK